MNGIHLTDLDAWAFLAILAFIMWWLGYKTGKAETDKWKNRYEGHISAFFGFMSKFPIVELKVTEKKDDAND